MDKQQTQRITKQTFENPFDKGRLKVVGAERKDRNGVTECVGDGVWE